MGGSTARLPAKEQSRSRPLLRDWLPGAWSTLFLGLWDLTMRPGGAHEANKRWLLLPHLQPPAAQQHGSLEPVEPVHDAASELEMHHESPFALAFECLDLAGDDDEPVPPSLRRTNDHLTIIQAMQAQDSGTAARYAPLPP